MATPRSQDIIPDMRCRLRSLTWLGWLVVSSLLAALATGNMAQAHSADASVEDRSRESVAEPVFAIAATPTALTTGKLRALVINIELPNGSATSRDDILKTYLKAAEQLRQLSRGKMEIQVEMYDTNVVVPVGKCSNTSTNTVASAAMQQAKTKLNLDRYRFISFVLPEISCGPLGSASGRYTWIAGNDLTFFSTRVVHELLHNLSLPHLNAMRCSVNNVPVQFASRDFRSQGACNPMESAGAYSIMGMGYSWNNLTGTVLSMDSSPPVLTYRERFQLGWMRPDESRTVNKGTYALQLDGSPAMLWVRNVEGDMFIVEFVKGLQPAGSPLRDDVTGVWAYPPHLGGVLVHYVKYRATTKIGGGYPITSYVLDMNPFTRHGLDAVMQSGQSFVDGTGTIRIDVASTTESSATVNVRRMPFQSTGSVNAVSAGQSCRKLGAAATSESGGETTKLVCTKTGKKLVWDAKETDSTASCATGGICALRDIGPGGGIVFFDAGSHQSWGRYLEAAPSTWHAGSSEDPVAKWGCVGTSISGASGTAIGTGAANTAAIVAGCAESGIAAKLADELTFGGKSDWFLPSANELSLMYANLARRRVGGFSGGGFVGFNYWSSSEVNAVATWFQDFTYEDPGSFSKYFSYGVRPVRAFG